MFQMDVDKELKVIESSIDETVINIDHSNGLYFPIRLSYFELNHYKEFIKKLNKERLACKSYTEKQAYVDKYKKIYLSERRKYNRLLRNLNNGTAEINYSAMTKEMEESVFDFFNFNPSISLKENVKDYMKKKLKQRINESNQELYKLKHYPADYINTFSTYIGPLSISKYGNNMIFYKDVFIAATDSHSYSVFYNENSLEDTKRALLNILAYFNGQPYFYFTENYDFNRKICDLYEQFDLLDMLRLRKNNFFNSKQKEPFHLELPILKRKNRYTVVGFEDSKHEMIFELYHASLKQFESLPRCVFLYRVFEYGAAHHYKQVFKPSNYKPEDALHYYVNEIMNHKYNPLFYVDFGTYLIEEEKRVITARKAKYINFTTKLKEEVKKIKKEWSNHSYLSKKTIGSIIYVTGRNAAAHGGSGRGNARYDYDMNYKHLNDVNIFLELIARYLIEKLNPNLANMVERRTSYYKKYNDYNVFNEQEKGQAE